MLDVKQIMNLRDAVAVLIIAAAGIVYAMIPKAVTDIDAGTLEGGAEMYIEDELSPEYKVAPDWFKDEQVTVVSDDENVVSVDENGTVHALTPGEATLTISARDYSEESVIHVVPKVTSIEGIDEEISLTTGGGMKIEPVLKPEEFASEPVTYSVSDSDIAKVEEDGTLTAVAAGETTLTVSAGGSTFESKITVSDPVVYRPRSSGSSGGSSGSSGSGSSGSGPANKGYFDSSDDEEF